MTIYSNRFPLTATTGTTVAASGSGTTLAWQTTGRVAGNIRFVGQTDQTVTVQVETLGIDGSWYDLVGASGTFTGAAGSAYSVSVSTLSMARLRLANAGTVPATVIAWVEADA